MSKILWEDLQRLGVNMPQKVREYIKTQNQSSLFNDYSEQLQTNKPIFQDAGNRKKVAAVKKGVSHNSMSFNEDDSSQDYKQEMNDSDDDGDSPYGKPGKNHESSSDSGTQVSQHNRNGSDPDALALSRVPEPRVPFDEKYLTYVLGIERQSFGRLNKLKAQVHLTPDYSFHKVGELLPSLQTLILSKSKVPELRYLSPGAFSNLQVLNLKHCDLCSLEGLTQLTQLDKLYASFNLLDSLWVGSGYSTVTYLDLEGNFLTLASLANFRNTFPRVAEIKLAENPLEWEDSRQVEGGVNFPLAEDENGWKIRVLSVIQTPKLRKIDDIEIKDLAGGGEQRNGSPNLAPQGRTWNRGGKREELKKRVMQEVDKLSVEEAMLKDFGRRYLYTPEMDELDRMIKEIDEREEELTEDVTVSKNNLNAEYRVKRVTNSRGSDVADRRVNGTYTGLPSTTNRRDNTANSLGFSGARANSSNAYRTTNSEQYNSGASSQAARTQNYFSKDLNRPRATNNAGYGSDQFSQPRIPRRPNLHNLDQENLDYISQEIRQPKFGNFTKNSEGPVRLKAEQGNPLKGNSKGEKMVGFGAAPSLSQKPPIKRK